LTEHETSTDERYGNDETHHGNNYCRNDGEALRPCAGRGSRLGHLAIILVVRV
jgi:hypothetical protein